MTCTPDKHHRTITLTGIALALGLALAPACAQDITPRPAASPAATSDTLSARQQAIAPIAAFMASSDMTRLNAALNQGLDAGLSISEAKEILVQLYAYVGFPRSLNALTELMKVVEARKQRGIQDAPVGRSRARCSTLRPSSTSSCKPTCSATSSNATTLTGKAANWLPSVHWLQPLAPRRNCSRTCAPACGSA